MWLFTLIRDNSHPLIRLPAMHAGYINTTIHWWCGVTNDADSVDFRRCRPIAIRLLNTPPAGGMFNTPCHCTVVGNGFTDGHGLERQSVLPITSERFDWPSPNFMCFFSYALGMVRCPRDSGAKPGPWFMTSLLMGWPTDFSRKSCFQPCNLLPLTGMEILCMI